MKNLFNPWYYFLNGNLIKKLKPVRPGDTVHFHSIEGCFRVQYVDMNYIYVYKRGSLIGLHWSDFRCRKNEGTSIQKELKGIIKSLDVIKLQIQNLIK